jgi:cyclopropane-fatty-acyl-phospholipid synthase
MAEHYPKARILAVSNSNGQREFITARAAALGLRNLEVVTCDMNHFDPTGRTFDRAVSVEMFEHMRNYHELLRRISTWLRPAGKLFVHIFCHRP